jgi:cardiolipin synthase A/B
MDAALAPTMALLVPLLWAGYLLVLAAWIVLQKRPPLSTLSWILGLAALPLLGFVVYFFLGPQKVRRQRLRRQRLRRLHHCSARGDPAAAAALPRRKRGLGALVEKATGAPVSSLQSIELLSGGAATFDALIEDIGRAREHVHLEYYIVEPDAAGNRLAAALIERAKAGIEVRLLIDAVGSANIGRRWLRPLRAAGVQVARFHPFRAAALRPLLNFRTHRKIAVIDGRVGYTGGVNISAQQDARLCAEAWHDLHLRMAGQAVGWLQALFAEDWLYARGHALPEQHLYPELAPGPVTAQIVASGPDSDSEAIHRAFLQAIHDARQRVWLVTPYFVPGEATLYALTNAALRGVEVSLLLPARSDSRFVLAASRSYYDELLARGVQIFEYQPSVLHAKALLVDDDCAFLGTANFDQRSFRLNFEVAVACYDRAFADRLAAQIAADRAAALRIVQPRGLSVAQRLAEAGARLFSPVL